jgi:hypothetical protein
MDIELGPAQGEGLYELVLRADRAACGPERLPVLSVELHAVSDEPACELGFEAVFGLQGGRRVTAQIDVRAHVQIGASSFGSVLESLCAEFGGADLTSLTIGCREADRIVEACDLTVSFPSKVPLWAHNLAFFGELTAEAMVAACAEPFGALGLRLRQRGSVLSVPARQLRRKPTAAAQAAAAARALITAQAVVLYTAPLPARRSATLAAERVPRGDDLDLRICLSRGLSREEAVISSHCSAMERYLTDLGCPRFSSLKWLGAALVADPSYAELVPASPKPQAFASNWLTRR